MFKKLSDFAESDDALRIVIMGALEALGVVAVICAMLVLGIIAAPASNVAEIPVLIEKTVKLQK